MNYGNYVVELKVPDKTIAIPVNWLVIEKTNDMIKIKKATVMQPPTGCGKHDWYSAVLDILPEPAGIKLDNGYRKLRYAELYLEKISHGYLVFEKTEEGWLVTNEKEPEVFVYTMTYELSSRTCGARYEVVSTENVIDVKTNEANCNAYGKASVFLLLQTDKEAIVEYKQRTGRYRGPCEEVIKKVKIVWNNGNPTETKTE